MIKGIIRIIICVSLLSFVMHPLHVSVTNMNIENNSLDITIKTFCEDWEIAFFHYYGKKADMKKIEGETKKWFDLYLKSSFYIKLNGSSDTLNFVVDSITYEDLSMTIKMHTKLTNPPKSLYIYNAILTDIFADQTNLLILSHQGREKGLRFDFKNKDEELLLK